jgi:hypothetical protein
LNYAGKFDTTVAFEGLAATHSQHAYQVDSSQIYAPDDAIVVADAQLSAGTTGNDVIFATGQGDLLTGNGGHDQFVFEPSNPSNTDAVEHTISNFNTSLDTIDLRQFCKISSASDVISTAVTHGSDTLLRLDDHETLLPKNLAASSLHARDFIVSPMLVSDSAAAPAHVD